MNLSPFRFSLCWLLLISAWTCDAQLNPSSWRVVSFTSENTSTGEQARHAIDGNPETQWHTQWHDPRKSPAAPAPHALTIDLRRSQTVNALRYRGRAHGEGGLPADSLVELSADGTFWRTVYDGPMTFRSPFSPHAVIPIQPPVKARFLRFTVRTVRETARATEPGLVVSELEVATPEHPLIPTTLIPVPQSREWAYGGYHWRTRHEAILALTRERRPQLVFLGDSITHQWGGPPQDVTPRPGEAVWNAFYAPRNALDLGYGWDRIENMIWRVQHGELDHTDARLVVVLAGTNNLEVNTPEEIAAGVDGLCREIHRRKPASQILLLGLFPRGNEVRDAALQETNRRLQSLARRRHLRFLDIGDVFLEADRKLTRAIMPDLLHLSSEGYRRWAQAIETEVARALKEPSSPR
ncbi:MAG: discoidin domain-containing protein [Verrucomicrobiales bacterium]|nr:discoidin domain-containing protein [Verrucomicrobiales bacterium]